MARKPRAIPVTTLKAVAACHAVGLTYHGGTGAMLVAVDDQGYGHWVLARTSRGVASAAHACRTVRDSLTGQLRNYGPLSREYTRIELSLVSPSWLCDQDGEFVDCLPTDGIMAAAGLFSTVEMSE